MPEQPIQVGTTVYSKRFWHLQGGEVIGVENENGPMPRYEVRWPGRIETLKSTRDDLQLEPKAPKTETIHLRYEQQSVEVKTPAGSVLVHFEDGEWRVTGNSDSATKDAFSIALDNTQVELTLPSCNSRDTNLYGADEIDDTGALYGADEIE